MIAEPNIDRAERLSLAMLIRYLAFQRAAIDTVARSRWSLAVGGLLVVAGGLARHYDSSDLLGQPWLVLRPMVASLVVSASIFLAVHLVAWVRLRNEPERPPLLSAYASFLGLFWMTAPLGLLYGVPYEHLLDEYHATAANIITLLVVSTWRVALMTRVVSVRYGFAPFAALCLIMVVADIAANVALSKAPLPTIDLMGGIQRTATESLIGETAHTALLLGVLSMPIWLVGAVVTLARSKARWPDLQRASAAGGTAGGLGAVPARPTFVLVLVALIAVILWVPLLPITQPPQIRASRIDALLRNDRIESALEEMSALRRSDFPPIWSPLPRAAFGEWLPRIEIVLETIEAHPPAQWVTELFARKAWDQIGRDGAQLRRAMENGDAAGIDYYGRRFGENGRRVDLLGLLVRLDLSLPVAEREALAAALDAGAARKSSGQNPTAPPRSPGSTTVPAP